jgi:hypothetical protein
MTEALSSITEQRHLIASYLEDLPGAAQVRLGPSEYGNAGMLSYVITIIVGEPGIESELVVDDLYEQVPEALMPMTNASVSHCSGHRLYADTPGTPPKMGAEWTVKVLA